MPGRTQTPYGVYADSEEGIRELIMEHIGLVKSLAAGFDVSCHPAVAFDDLISAGTVGLIEAAHRYRRDTEAKFSTFAYQRIRGAMLDLLRSHDPLGKSARSRLSEIKEAIRAHRAEHRHSPSIQELARRIESTETEVIRYLSYERWDSMGSLGGPPADDGGERPSTLDVLLESDVGTPLEQLEKTELAERLAEAITALSEREQQVIVMYYYEELYMAEIAEVLGVTQSRVSQIHTSAIYNLGRKLREVMDDG